MNARLLISNGLWAIQWPHAARPVFTRFPAATRPEKVLKAIQREYPDDTFEPPPSTGWLFEMTEAEDDTHPYEMSAPPLFAEV